MRQTTELTRVKARINALAEKTISNGCTAAETMPAAEMVGRLLERYELSMDAIDVREKRCVHVEAPIGGKRRRPIDACVTAIARFCDCKVWVSRDTAVPSYVSFGFDADTAMTSYLFSVIDRAMRTELMAFRATNSRLRGPGLRNASRSFLQGMAEARIADRLNEMRRVAAAGLSRGRLNGAFRHNLAAGDCVNLSRLIDDVRRPPAAVSRLPTQQALRLGGAFRRTARQQFDHLRSGARHGGCHLGGDGAAVSAEGRASTRPGPRHPG